MDNGEEIAEVLIRFLECYNVELKLPYRYLFEHNVIQNVVHAWNKGINDKNIVLMSQSVEILCLFVIRDEFRAPFLGKDALRLIELTLKTPIQKKGNVSMSNGLNDMNTIRKIDSMDDDKVIEPYSHIISVLKLIRNCSLHEFFMTMFETNHIERQLLECIKMNYKENTTIIFEIKRTIIELIECSPDVIPENILKSDGNIHDMIAEFISNIKTKNEDNDHKYDDMLSTQSLESRQSSLKQRKSTYWEEKYSELQKSVLENGNINGEIEHDVTKSTNKKINHGRKKNLMQLNQNKANVDDDINESKVEYKQDRKRKSVELTIENNVIYSDEHYRRRPTVFYNEHVSSDVDDSESVSSDDDDKSDSKSNKGNHETDIYELEYSQFDPNMNNYDDECLIQLNEHELKYINTLYDIMYSIITMKIENAKIRRKSVGEYSRGVGPSFMELFNNAKKSRMLSLKGSVAANLGANDFLRISNNESDIYGFNINKKKKKQIKNKFMELFCESKSFKNLFILLKLCNVSINDACLDDNNSSLSLIFCRLIRKFLKYSDDIVSKLMNDDYLDLFGILILNILTNQSSDIKEKILIYILDIIGDITTYDEYYINLLFEPKYFDAFLDVLAPFWDKYIKSIIVLSPHIVKRKNSSSPSKSKIIMRKDSSLNVYLDNPNEKDIKITIKILQFFRPLCESNGFDLVDYGVNERILSILDYFAQSTKPFYGKLEMNCLELCLNCIKNLGIDINILMDLVYSKTCDKIAIVCFKFRNNKSMIKLCCDVLSQLLTMEQTVFKIVDQQCFDILLDTLIHIFSESINNTLIASLSPSCQNMINEFNLKHQNMTPFNTNESNLSINDMKCILQIIVNMTIHSDMCIKISNSNFIVLLFELIQNGHVFMDSSFIPLILSDILQHLISNSDNAIKILVSKNVIQYIFIGMENNINSHGVLIKYLRCLSNINKIINIKENKYYKSNTFNLIKKLYPNNDYINTLLSELMLNI